MRIVSPPPKEDTLLSDPKEHTLLSHMFGERLKVREVEINPDEVEQIERSFEEQGSKFELFSVKVVPIQDSTMRSARRCMYVKVSGPNVETIDLEKCLSEIADFGSLSSCKAASRLELLESPAAKLSQGYALFSLKDEDLTEIEEGGHDGCGFICEEMLDDLLSCNRTQERLVSIQVRIYAPNLGLFKGVLAKKRMTDGNKIELPRSMRRVPPSKTGNTSPLLLINNAGIDPSKTAEICKRLNCIDKEGDGGPKKYSLRPRKLTDMIERLWIGLGVPKDKVTSYVQRSGNWLNVNHAYVRGIADPTGKLPPGHAYVTGIKNQDTRDFLEKNQGIFMTRLPSMKCSQATKLKVITKKPIDMTDSEFEWLENLPFGAIIFAFPSEGKLPIPETIGGDLDGDRYFLCWDKVILPSLSKIKQYVEVNDPEARSDGPSNVQSTSKEGWLSDIQAHMESVEGMEVKALVGKLYTISKKYAEDDHEMSVSNKNAEAFADAYYQALDSGKRKCKIELPRHLHKEVKPKKLQKYLTAPEEE